MTELYVNGEYVTPVGVMEALDIVEEELGTDLRQYLESALMEDGMQESWEESELVSELKEHYLSVLDAIDVSASALEQQLSQSRISRKKLMDEVESIRNIIEREEKRA